MSGYIDEAYWAKPYKCGACGCVLAYKEDRVYPNRSLGIKMKYCWSYGEKL